MSLDEHLQVQNYVLERTLGKGTFGKVKLARHLQADEHVAIKILEKAKIETAADVTRVQREIQILRKLRHPNIIQLYEILQSDSNVYLVMEYARGGELFDHIVKKTKLSEVHAAKFFMQLINAVEFMHQNKIVHRDLKPENLLLDENQNLKVADFGLGSLYTVEGQLLTACGSPCYAAPEMLYGRPYSGRESDTWTCGIILYAMICGFLPFENTNTKVLYEMIKHDDFERPAHLSAHAINLLMRILTKDPRQRIDFDGIRAHPFFRALHLEPQSLPPLRDPNTLQKMKKMGFQPEEVIIKLESNKHDSVTAIYFLLFRKLHNPLNVTKKAPFLETFSNLHKFKLDFKPQPQPEPMKSSTGGSNSKDMLKKMNIRKIEIPSRLETTQQKLKSLQNSVQIKQIENTVNRQKATSVHEGTHFPSPDARLSAINSRKGSNNISILQVFRKKNTTEYVNYTEKTEEAIKPPSKNRNRTQPMKQYLETEMPLPQTRVNKQYNQNASLHQQQASPYIDTFQQQFKVCRQFKPAIKIRHSSYHHNGMKVPKVLNSNFV